MRTKNADIENLVKEFSIFYPHRLYSTDKVYEDFLIYFNSFYNNKVKISKKKSDKNKYNMIRKKTLSYLVNNKKNIISYICNSRNTIK